MGIKRIVDTSFWSDDMVVERFSCEDKYFMLYLLTNPHTTQLGIYQLTKKIAAFELGYSLDSVNVLLDRFENKYHLLKYNEETKEVAIKNYLVYSVIKGGKPVEDLLLKEMKEVKEKSLIDYVFGSIYQKTNLNITIKKIISLYQNDNEKENDKENENDNDNENEVSYHESYNESLHESYHKWLEGEDEEEKEVELTCYEIDFLKKTYPNINVEEEVERMNEWLAKNPNPNRTKKDVSLFVFRWLNRIKKGEKQDGSN